MQFFYYLKRLLLLVFLCLSLSVQAEQKQTLGQWDVHYIAIPTTFLTPEVASSNQIVRSKYSSLINISVLDNDSKAAQSVSVRGKAVNLLGTTKPLSFKQVKEGSAIYYLATVGFSDQETLRFTIDIQLGNEIQQLKFQQKMYAE
ncbi:DUF4426 domain-containing protein [Agaribacter flavus]|uniref:DUF4426 domain-containing protein n=1 Tax=Agaribacter flavus TaxID=1902781 RepID=A0ABV7FML1_9ALTE